jgi:hypothetical protein
MLAEPAGVLLRARADHSQRPDRSDYRSARLRSDSTLRCDKGRSHGPTRCGRGNGAYFGLDMLTAMPLSTC